MSAAETIFRGVLEISWRSSWLILAVIALRAGLRGRLPARVVFWAWIAVAIRLLWPFTVAASWSPFGVVPFSSPAQPTIVSNTTPSQSKASEGSATLGADPKASITLSAPSTTLFSGLTLAQGLAVIWSAGVVALLLMRSGAHARFVRALRRSRRAPNPALTASLAARPVFAGSPINITVTESVRAPALHGLIRPALLFPPGFIEQLTPDELDHIVAHELAHAQRRDLLAQVLIHGAAILHWFNPLVWVAARLAREDCELACDEFVSHRLSPPEREAYATTLLKIVRLTQCGAPPPLALGVAESKQQIKRRIVMIVTQPSSLLARTLLGCALFSLLTVLSLTSETRAQVAASAPAVSEAKATPPRKTDPGLPESQWKFVYDASTDRLDALFPNGVAATVGDKVITVEDVRREIRPLVPMLQREARNQEDFILRINRLQNSVIKDLVGRVLYIKEFHAPRPGEGAKSIPEAYVDNALADRLKDQFDNDRAKLLAYLQTRGITMTEFRHEIEEEIIYHYMIGQERNLNKNENEKKAKPGGAEGQVHLRLIQLTRSTDTTDAALLEKANLILARFKNGETFEALAREFSGDGRRSKGGDWGWMSPGDLQPVYSEKAFALKKGEVSEPILLKEGCFLLYADDRK